MPYLIVSCCDKRYLTEKQIEKFELYTKKEEERLAKEGIKTVRETYIPRGWPLLREE